jgi:sugar lactone lactonase YvrE
MGSLSITYLPRLPRDRTCVLLLLLLSFACSSAALAQTSALTVPLILPSAITFDASGNLYLAEAANHVIRKVDLTGQITTIAGTNVQGFSGDGGPAASATLDSPVGLALDTANNLYIADSHNHRIRKLNLGTGTITTIAGTTPGFSGDNAPASSAQLNLPTALALDSANNLYIADTGNHRIRRIDAKTGIITTVAGNGLQGFSGDNGIASAAAIDSPGGLAFDATNDLFITDTHNHRVRRLDAITGVITTIAGSGLPTFSGDMGQATIAAFNLPRGITIDSAGNLYVADSGNQRIRRIDATTNLITTVAGDGTQTFSGDDGLAIAASLDTPSDAAITPTGLLTFADSGNQRIRQLTANPTPTIQTIAGLGLTAPAELALAGPSATVYGTGQLTASLASITPVAGSVTFLDTTTALPIGTAPLIANIATLSMATLPAGVYNLIATYSGDQTHPASQSSVVTLAVAPQTLTATLAPITLLYGQTIPAITGVLNGVLPQDLSRVAATFTTAATSSSPVGIYPITVALSGPSSANYVTASQPASLTINPTPTGISWSNTTPTDIAGSAITLTAVVSSSTNAVPTGSIALYDGASILLTTPISQSGNAVFTIPSLAQGSHSLTAVFSGNTNFNASRSAPQLITIEPAATSDFTIASSGAITQTIASGSSAIFNFTVQTQGELYSPIELAASGYPNLTSASFNPSVLPPGYAGSFTLTLSTPNSIASKRSYSAATPLLVLLLFPYLNRRRTKMRLIAACALSLSLLAPMGCGNRISTQASSANPPNSYTVTITGTATTSTGDKLQHSTTVILLVQSLS